MGQILAIADVDGDKQLALQRAISAQEITGQKIIFLGFCYADVSAIEAMGLNPTSNSDLKKHLLESKKQQLTTIVDRLARAESDITIIVQWGKDIAKAIVAYCGKKPIDYVFKTQSKQGVIVHTPTDWQLFRESPCPVLIIANKPYKSKSNLLAAVDLGTKSKSKALLNDKIATNAIAIGRLTNSKVTFCYVITPPQALVDLDIIDSEQYFNKVVLQLEHTITLFCDKHAIQRDQLLLRSGAVEKVIPSIANELKSKLVVCGTVGRKGLKARLLGNTAETTLARLYTDLLIVKP